MTEGHISLSDHARYLARMLTSPELLAFDDHLQTCSDCRQRIAAEVIARAEDFIAAVSEDLPEQEHLDYEMMERLAESRSDPAERARAETHIALCALCAAEVNDLRAFAGGPIWRAAFSPTRSLKWAAAASIALLVGGILFTLAHRRSGDGMDGARGIPGSPVVIHDGNGSIVLDRTGNIHGAPPGSDSLIREALMRSRLAQLPFDSDVDGVPQSLRGSDGESSLRVVSPVRGVLLDDTPLFEWNGGDHAAIFVVEVFDSGFRPVLRSTSISAWQWRPPRALPRGQELQWQVTAIQGDRHQTAPSPPSPPARFLIVDAASAAQIERAKVSKSHLFLGILYARTGMHDEALAELTVLANLNPSSALVSRLKESLRSEHADHTQP